MKKFGLSILALFVFIIGEAQRGSIKVNIVNDKQAALENATVEVVKAKDSSLVKAGITDKNGLAELDNIRFGDYLLRVTMINYEVQYSSFFSISAERSTVTL